MRHRITLPSVLVCALAACGEPPSPVAPPARTGEFPAVATARSGPPTPVDPTPGLLPSHLCPFPVQGSFTGKVKLIFLPGGRIFAGGPALYVTLTNLANGRSATFNITGAYHLTFLPNGDVTTTLTGRNTFWYAFDPGLWVTIGQFTYTTTLTGAVVTPLAGTGQLIDVCALLA